MKPSHIQPPKHSQWQQSALAQYCRTDVLPAQTRVAADRAQHYRRLVYNVIDDGLQSAYPLTRQLLSEEEWDAVVLEFHANHACQSAQVWRMPREWMLYLQEKAHPLLQQYPQLGDLLAFEWAEIELYMQEDLAAPAAEAGALVLNPEYRLLPLRYPVHLLSPAEIEPDHAGNYFVWLHRHPQTGKVYFTDVSAPIAQWLLLLAEGKHSAESALATLCQQYHIALTPDIQAAIDSFLHHAQEIQLIF